MIYNPKVTILDVAPTDGGVKILCQFDSPYQEPLAPGALYSEPQSGDARYEVHRMITRQTDLVTFETLGNQASNPPHIGETYYFRGWWLPEALKAALDTSVVWTHADYPANSDHAHCLFTWETIAAYAECKTGYFCKDYGWITEQAYRDHIQHDIYHLRDSPSA